MDNKTRMKRMITKLKHTYGSTMLGRMKRDPFRILIATVLSARTKDETTESVSEKLFRRYPDADSLAAAKVKDVERMIKKTGFYRVKARRIIGLAKMVRKGVPDDMESLVKLPGIGRKTAGCVLVYAFGKQAIPVDTHVHRISNRLGLVRTKHPEKTEQELMRITPKSQWTYVNDLFVHHGKNVCKPIRPVCKGCMIEKICRYENKDFS
ncbi:MAG: endonuclease III [Nanoarchaeota archaeon]|nr:endonuclease III [Nanoarchaeota archaeon]